MDADYDIVKDLIWIQANVSFGDLLQIKEFRKPVMDEIWRNLITIQTNLKDFRNLISVQEPLIDHLVSRLNYCVFLLNQVHPFYL